MPGPGEFQPTSQLRPQTRSTCGLSGLWAVIVLCAAVGCGKGAYIDRMDKQVKALHNEAEAKKKNANSGRPKIPGAEGDAAADDAAADGAAGEAAAADGADGGAPAEEGAAGGEAPAE